MVAVAIRRLFTLTTAATTARPAVTAAALSRPAFPLASSRPSATGAPLPLLRNNNNRTTTRAMSTDAAAPQKYEWLVILPDQDGALPRRMEVRQQHLSNLQAYPSDFWLWGGGFLGDVPKEGEPMQMLGSVMLAWAATKDEVLDALKRDVYTENQVWDWSKVQIHPFKSAIRKPL